MPSVLLGRAQAADRAGGDLQSGKQESDTGNLGGEKKCHHLLSSQKRSVPDLLLSWEGILSVIYPLKMELPDGGKEKCLVLGSGNSWHTWISVQTCLATTLRNDWEQTPVSRTYGCYW